MRRARPARVLAALLPGFLVLAPGAARACAVCFDTTDENRWAFLATTIFLSLLPLGLLLGVGAWLRRKVREIEREHEAARLAPPARSGAPSARAS